MVLNAEVVTALQAGALHRFADWPNPNVPGVAIGLYTIWGGDEFVYVGMAGRASAEVL